MYSGQKNLYELSQSDGNEICADCKCEPDVSGTSASTHVDKTFGVFLCEECAKVHEKLTDLCEVVPIPSCINDLEIIKKCSEIGNVKANEDLESFVPTYLLRPKPFFTEELSPLREEFVIEKYKNKIYTKGNESEFNIQMPEVTFESEFCKLKGKSNWNKVWVLHLHLWLNIYDNPMMNQRLLKIESNMIESVDPIKMKTKDKKDKGGFPFEIRYKVEKSGKKKDKTLTLLSPDLEKMKTLITSLRKAMVYYKIPDNLPKRYNSTKITEISTLITRNCIMKGWLFKRTGRKWNKRYFSLLQMGLYYFKKEGETKTSGLISLYNTDLKRRPQSLTERKFSFVVIGEDENHLLAAEDEKTMASWIEKLRNMQHEFHYRKKFDFSQKILDESQKEE